MFKLNRSFSLCTFAVLSVVLTYIHFRGIGAEPTAADWLAKGSLKNGFPTYIETVKMLDELEMRYPISIQSFDIGKSFEERTIKAYVIGTGNYNENFKLTSGQKSNTPVSLMTSIIHPREVAGLTTLLYFLYALINFAKQNDPTCQYVLFHHQIIFVPFINPDGYIAMDTLKDFDIRKNRRKTCPGGDAKSQGVDLNRNFDYGFEESNELCSEEYPGTEAFSEPETQTFRSLLENSKIDLAINLHTYGDVWTHPLNCCADKKINVASQRIYDEIKMDLGLDTFDTVKIFQYPVSGEANDWLFKKNVLSMAPEIGMEKDEFWPPSEQILSIARDAFPLLLSTILKAGPELTLEARLDKDNYSIVKMTIHNSGLQKTKSFGGRMLFFFEKTSSSGSNIVDAMYRDGSYIYPRLNKDIYKKDPSLYRLYKDDVLDKYASVKTIHDLDTPNTFYPTLTVNGKSDSANLTLWEEMRLKKNKVDEAVLLMFTKVNEPINRRSETTYILELPKNINLKEYEMHFVYFPFTKTIRTNKPFYVLRHGTLCQYGTVSQLSDAPIYTQLHFHSNRTSTLCDYGHYQINPRPSPSDLSSDIHSNYTVRGLQLLTGILVVVCFWQLNLLVSTWRKKDYEHIGQRGQGSYFSSKKKPRNLHD